MSAFDWMGEALCAQTDPELFHPDSAGSGYRQAQKTCAACPVRRQCEEHAAQFEGGISRNHRHGMWAGATPNKRASRSAETVRAERDALILRLYDRGGMTPAQIADTAECDVRTVQRVTAAHRKKYGTAA